MIDDNKKRKITYVIVISYLISWTLLGGMYYVGNQTNLLNTTCLEDSKATGDDFCLFIVDNDGKIRLYNIVLLITAAPVYVLYYLVFNIAHTLYITKI